jgi:hypothetical protein
MVGLENADLCDLQLHEFMALLFGCGPPPYADQTVTPTQIDRQTCLLI